ncbi:MAG: DUF1934 domain-containing protein [Ruminococcaceae bacterium]|nr:DUF1934 domain-containing protein [Oscillospiraceae bacterium]
MGDSMDTNALITLSGNQFVDGESDQYELTTLGKYIKKGDKYYITYEGSELTGYEGTTTTLKIRDGCVSMIRFGQSTSQMIFEKEKKYVGYYETPFGSMSVGVTTNSLKVDMDEDGGEIDLDYLVELNNSMPVHNGLHLKIRKVGNQE